MRTFKSLLLRSTLLTALFVGLYSCSNSEAFDPVKYVNPFIGTDLHGHTYPGATSPFGMVQLSPDTRLDGWDGCSGYHYSDSVIYGFSHTHLSGTGVSDYGDLLIMPFNGASVFNNTDYASTFKHENETAEAGYYRVLLDQHQIEAELTSTTRTGMHRYQFPNTGNNKIIIDLNHRDFVIDSYFKLINDSTIEGYRISRAWAQEQHFYFYMQLSKPVSQLELMNKQQMVTAKAIKSNAIKAVLSFDAIHSLSIKVGVSAVSIEGAKANLEAENSSWDFDQVKADNQASWRQALSKIEIDEQNEDKEKMTVFYTALYHNMIVPNTFSDVNGQYRGMDQKIHESDKTQYTIFSLWDTYRATHPLYTIIETERTKAFINTFRNQYRDGGILPIWELSANYTGCMIGYHSIPVIADAYLKGLTDIPVDELLEMMMHSANQDHLGLAAYKKKAYISIEDDAESVSKTLEYAFDDWCIAQVAKKAGKDSIYEIFIKRAQSYKNILDPETGCMRPKLNETWKTPFDPSEVDFNYTEANSWQYSFYVPQDLYTFIDYLGGDTSFEQHLDALFSASSETKGRHQSDITGLIGQYAHGNEPSHHMAYLYNYVNQAKKTQHYVKRIIDELYNANADGLCGNEDCGQMSAWYVFSALGFYPVNPSDGSYIFGLPIFNKVTIHLENDKDFVLEKQHTGPYLKAIYLNGEAYNKAYLKHEDLMKGGKLVYEMSENEVIQYEASDLPNSKIEDHLIMASPSIRTGERVFRDSTIITIEAEKGCKIMLKINEGEAIEYQQPLFISAITKLEMWAEKEAQQSPTVTARFYKIPEGREISLTHPWHKQYAAGGNDALIDGITGTNNFRTGAWQGYYFDDLEAVVNLGKAQKVNEIHMNFIQDTRSWIWIPPYVEYWGSQDGKHFFPLGKVENDVPTDKEAVTIKDFHIKIYPKKLKYIKVKAKNGLYCPNWHPGAGLEAFIFADEIIIN
jgi:predicted alpha-1,2-mannosidase